MRLPFTTEQFLDVFARYNEAVWPAQWLLLALALAAVALAFRESPSAGRWVAAILAALWLWMAAAYHLAFFRAINPAAVAFAALFVVQALLLAWAGVWRGRIASGQRSRPALVAGLSLVAYALVLYPAFGLALGHRWPAMPTFGLPCPTTIFTLGVLLLAAPAAPRVLLVIPLLWAAIGTSAAMQLGMREDFGLVAAGVVTVLVTMLRHRRSGDRRWHSRRVVRAAVVPSPTPPGR